MYESARGDSVLWFIMKLRRRIYASAFHFVLSPVLFRQKWQFFVAHARLLACRPYSVVQSPWPSHSDIDADSRNLQQLDVVETDAVIMPYYAFMALTKEILKLPTDPGNKR